MKISDVIRNLEAMKEREGDVEVLISVADAAEHSPEMLLENDTLAVTEVTRFHSGDEMVVILVADDGRG